MKVIARIAVLIVAPVITVAIRPFNVLTITTIRAIGDILILFIIAVAVPTLTIPLPVAGVVPAPESATFGAGGIAGRTPLAVIHS